MILSRSAGRAGFLIIVLTAGGAPPAGDDVTVWTAPEKAHWFAADTGRRRNLP